MVNILNRIYFPTHIFMKVLFPRYGVSDWPLPKTINNSNVILVIIHLEWIKVTVVKRMHTIKPRCFITAMPRRLTRSQWVTNER